MVHVPSPRRSEMFRAPEARYGRSQIDLSRTHKTSFDAGRLIPYLVQEVVPGDTFTCKATIFARVFSPLQAPIMDDIEMSIDYFYVPNRILWDNWHAFLGEHDAAGAQDTTYTIPKLATGQTVGVGSVAHYMGVPVGLSTTNTDVQVLPFRAYYAIYDEWYRDQNVINGVNVSTGDGANSIGMSAPRLSAKRHDYFTSGLPYLQKGSEQTAALTGRIRVETDALDNNELGIYQTGDAGWRMMDIGTSTKLEVQGTAALNADRIWANLAEGETGSSGISINALREAAAVQRLLEKDARAGTRPNELIRAHFGVEVPDFRVDRPEYLGGGTGYVNVSPVAITRLLRLARTPVEPMHIRVS